MRKSAACIRALLYCLIVVGIGSLLLLLQRPSPNHDIVLSTEPFHTEPDMTIVMAKMPNEDTSWLANLHQWRPYIYTTPADNTSSLNLPPGSKGREAFAYLTYIIEKYDSLAPLTAFVHAAPTQWHNDADPETKSTAQLLSALQLDIVRERGFVNLRCTASPGCPVAVRPFDPVFKAKGNPVYSEFADIYMGLFNVSLAEVPVEIGGVCCGQFVVSAERIRQRGKDEYVRMREWAMGSDLDDLGVGSVFEMVWHVIFGEGAVLCPDTTTCYCELYRQCDT